MKIKQLEKQIMRWMCLFVGLLFVSNELDNDCWFLLNHGRYVVEYGIPYIEPFTIHENFSFVMQQWLTSVVFWEIYKYFGPVGLVITLYVVGALTIYAFYRLVLMTSEGNRDTALVISSFVGILISCFFIRTRPQIFSTLIFILEFIGLEMLRLTNDRKCLFLFPLLSLVLINMHAAMWPMMLIFLLPFLLDYCDRYDTYGWLVHDGKIKIWYLLFIALLVVVAGFINPYGWDAMTYVFRSYGYDLISNNISEMQPITVRTGLGRIFELIFLLVIVLYARHKITVRYMIVTFGMMLMAASSIRNIYLFLAIGLYPLAYIYRDWHGLIKPIKRTYNTRIRKILILMINCAFLLMVIAQEESILKIMKSEGHVLFVIMMIAVCAIAFAEWKRGYLNIVRDKTLRFGYASVIVVVCCSIFLLIGYRLANSNRQPGSAQAVDYILQHDQSNNVRMWSNYYDGPYIEFRGLSCFLDARAEVFLISNNKQRDVLYEYFSLEKGKVDYRTFLSWYDFNYILVTENDIMYTYLPSDDNYELVLNYTSNNGEKYCLYHVK